MSIDGIANRANSEPSGHLVSYLLAVRYLPAPARVPAVTGPVFT